MKHAKLGTLCLILSTAICAAQVPVQEVAEGQEVAPVPGQAAAAAQNRAQKPAAPKQAPAKEKTEQEKEIEKQEQSQRLLGVLPQFAVTSRHDVPPLTHGEKFHLFAKSAFDPVEFGIVGLQAGVSQAENEFPEYGQGAEGYAKRYGASFADEVSSAFWSDFFWASTLKEDPRYFRMGHGPFMRRLGYALVQGFDCRTDKGTRTFNWANSLGALSSGGFSNMYYPPGDRGFELTMSRAGIALLYGTVGSLPDEFWPDIRQRLFRKHHPPADLAPAKSP